MKVSIIENSSEIVVKTYEVTLDTLDHSPSAEEYYSQAWLRAVEDGIVEQSDYSNYSLTFCA